MSERRSNPAVEWDSQKTVLLMPSAPCPTRSGGPSLSRQKAFRAYRSSRYLWLSPRYLRAWPVSNSSRKAQYLRLLLTRGRLHGALEGLCPQRRKRSRVLRLVDTSFKQDAVAAWLKWNICVLPTTLRQLSIFELPNCSQHAAGFTACT